MTCHDMEAALHDYLDNELDGEPCSNPARCASGFCADGACCNTRCDGQCEACDVEDATGMCTPVVGKPHGERPACDEGDREDLCTAASCDGAARRS